ncbi:hypothetical protein NQ318_005124 [Aromia moschata]|uniref:Uncharacterized protein n=1 Tax=Aromia moschata TaxID=1265417 RepID=A0AAV8XTG7_9CUCU|nr:hypothetical protein NQ318_005124 [Aromia moschata]
MSRSKSFQTEEDKCTCHVGIQTQVDKKHQILQTPNELCNAENKRSQTQRCCQNAAIQTAHIAHQVISGSGDEEGMNRGVNFIDKLKITRSSTLHENKVDVGCVCETNQGTQTLGEKRVFLTCSSQSEGSRPVSPIECVCSHSAGISRLRKKKKVSKSADNRCTCCKGKIKPKTITIEQYESKTESLGSDTRYTMSSTSVVTTSHGNTESASDPLSGTPDQSIFVPVTNLSERMSCMALKKPLMNFMTLNFVLVLHRHVRKNNQYCTHCLMKLKHTARTKNGIAYTLTLEEKSPHKEKRQRKKLKKSSLEEIRIKIPCPYNKKVQKDKINLCRQDGDKEGVSVGFVECITTESNHRKSPKVKPGLNPYPEFVPHQSLAGRNCDARVAKDCVSLG